MIEKETQKVNVVAGVVLEKDAKYLLVQEKKTSAYGQWNLPAGKVEVGDTLEQTATKEAKEETGYDVEIVRRIGIYQENAENPVKHTYEAKIIGGVLKVPEDEILGAKWFTFEEIKAMADQTRGQGYVIQTIEDCINLR